MKQTDQNALTIHQAGGAILSSEWTSGTGRFTSRRAVPTGCALIEVFQICKLKGATKRAALRLLRQHPRAQRMVVLIERRRINALARKVEADRLLRKAVEAVEEAEAVEAVANQTVEEWITNPVHPAPHEVVGAKWESGLSWSRFQAQAETLYNVIPQENGE